MRGRFNIRLFLISLLVFLGSNAFAQISSELPAKNMPRDVLSSIGVPSPKLTPIQDKTSATALPVKVLYDGPKLSGKFTLSIRVSRRRGLNFESVSLSTLYLQTLDAETDAVVTLSEISNGLQVEATLRDENQNLVLETAHPLPVLSRDLRLLKLTAESPPVTTQTNISDFIGMESISGKIILPRGAMLPPQAVVHVQLLENALAGGLSMQLAAQDARPVNAKNGVIEFSLQRGVWDRRNEPDLVFKTWIADAMGRKIYVMSKSVGYNGPDIEYTLRLDGLKQGRETKQGQNLDPALMAQVRVTGEAQVEPVIGLPGQARLHIKLSQDRGDFNNPILAEQTLLLRGLETRIPFTLTTDSKHFDPYVPAPFLSISLTDSLGRVYYTSGDVRAREKQNFIRLYPR